jgi:SAM-dependent methyltransferase
VRLPQNDISGPRTAIGPDITDVAGEPTEATQLRRLIARYHWAAQYCTDNIVLEAACGTGQGLGLLRSHARKVYACDLSPENLETARKGNGPGQPLVRADAQVLPFADQSLDVVIILEALYFLPSADAFVSEVQRVLRPGGWCVISTINKDCIDFNPKHSLYRALYGTREVSGLLSSYGFQPECFGIIPMNAPSARTRAFAPIKKFAIGMNLVPESKKARLFLKRIVFGPLDLMPRDISKVALPVESPRALPTDEPDRIHQVILCAGRKS